MPDELRIVVTGSADLPEQSRKALSDALTKHGQDLVDEAGRLAAAQHSGSGDPMVTPGMVTDVAVWLRRGYIQQKRTTRVIIAEAVIMLATFIGGIFINNVTKPWGAVGMVICGALALFCFHWRER
ncbi:hypothetical protein [Actinomadura sp. NTSP31]|uniref:hypothetical protein n=1 Tax=Actinomadura sp. NTSP31 TaxID=1735447 RepID=UPI0035C0C0F7